jgi:hypothetical protein
MEVVQLEFLGAVCELSGGEGTRWPSYSRLNVRGPILPLVGLEALIGAR